MGIEDRMTDNQTLSQYYDSLERHDWYYMMSDDHGVYTRGSANELILRRVAKSKGPSLERMFQQFHSHKFTGGPWGTTQTPLPERPTE